MFIIIPIVCFVLSFNSEEMHLTTVLHMQCNEYVTEGATDWTLIAILRVTFVLTIRILRINKES